MFAILAGERERERERERSSTHIWGNFQPVRSLTQLAGKSNEASKTFPNSWRASPVIKAGDQV